MSGLRSAVVGVLALVSLCAGPGRLAAQDDAARLDSLLAPIALYPDALLAQVLTAATSPDQVKEFADWLPKQTVTGSDLQQKAMDEKFDAAFCSLALFPDVIKTLSSNMDWTKEIGTAYLSDADKVSASVQRLRAAANKQGNLKSGEQQTVKVEGSGSTQTIIIEPANPQVVYVPSYPTTVYTQPAPPPSSDGSAAVGAFIGFAAGIAIGAAISNDYYGWGAWGWGWHGGGVYYHRSVWVVPVRPRYPYVRPVPGYRPSNRVYAPRNTNINVNVNNNRINTGDVNIGNKKVNSINPGDRGGQAGGRAGGQDNNRGRDNNVARDNRSAGNNLGSSRGRESSGGNLGSGHRSGGGSSAMGGYGSGSSTRAASSRGRASAGAARGGGGARGGGRRR